MLKADGVGNDEFLEYKEKPLVRHGDDIYYGDLSDKTELCMKDCELEFIGEPTSLVKAYAFKRIALENVKVSGIVGDCVASWGEDGELSVKNCEGLNDVVRHATEPFSCKAI